MTVNTVVKLLVFLGMPCVGVVIGIYLGYMYYFTLPGNPASLIVFILPIGGIIGGIIGLIIGVILFVLYSKFLKNS